MSLFSYDIRSIDGDAIEADFFYNGKKIKTLTASLSNKYSMATIELLCMMIDKTIVQSDQFVFDAVLMP